MKVFSRSAARGRKKASSLEASRGPVKIELQHGHATAFFFLALFCCLEKNKFGLSKEPRS